MSVVRCAHGWSVCWRAGRFMAFGEVQEHAFEVARAVRRGDLGRRAVGDDTPVRQEHDALADLLDVAHVVTRHQAARCRALARARAVRSGTRSATSGSSEAVGSSSTSRCGRCSVARTMPTSVRWPDESSVPIASARCSMRNRARPACDRVGRVGDPVELPVELEVLAHAHALGEREVAGRESDVRSRLAALPIERVPADRHRPGIGLTTPSTINNVVVLPAPFGPSSATRSPACTTRSTPSTARARR